MTDLLELPALTGNRHPITEQVVADAFAARNGFPVPRIIDCFPFYNELDLLDIRLAELKDVVDCFVIVEAAETFSGKPKEYVFEANGDRFRDYPIHYIKIPQFPEALTTPWQREAYTRDALFVGLQGLNLAPTDVIMLSDVDEIPRASAMRPCAELVASGQVGPCAVLEQPLSYYYVNCISSERWHGTRMVRRDHFTSFQELRDSGGTIIADAGWHFSYLGGPEAIRRKIGAYSHTEYDRPEITDAAHIQECMARGADLFGREMAYGFVPLDETFPSHLLRNRDRYAHLVWSEPPRSLGLDEYFRQAVRTPSDINEHLAYLNRLASTVGHVTEFGTRSGCSTSAFLQARPKRLVCYDLERKGEVSALEQIAADAAIDFEFRERDVRTVEIEPTDLLFIDTWHVEEQMREELCRHAHKARAYLVMHDTETFGHNGESPGHRGVWYAISEYMQTHPEWRLLQHIPHNNGLTVFARVGA